MAKEKKTAVVRSQERLGDDIFSMWIQAGEVSQARAGQFISVYSKDGSRLLPRPIGSCAWSTGWWEREPGNFPPTRRGMRSPFWGLWAMDFRMWRTTEGRF